MRMEFRKSWEQTKHLINDRYDSHANSYYLYYYYYYYSCKLLSLYLAMYFLECFCMCFVFFLNRITSALKAQHV